MLTETKPYTILVIEDNPGDYFLLEQYFKMTKLPIVKMVHAETMAEAASFIKENQFDFAMLDLTLPDSTGLDSVIMLNKFMPKIPIIVFSGLATIEMAIESISLGAEDYLVKGEFDEKVLAKSIRYSIERKKTIEKLEESEETFRRVFDESADPILLLDDARFIDCNQSAVSILGFASRAEVINKKPWEISPEKQPDGELSFHKAKVMLAIALEKGFNKFEWVHKKSDETEFNVEVMLTSVILHGKQMYYTLWRDITERKKAEEKLKESLERYELVNKATSDTIWEWDLLKDEIKRNEVFGKTYGYEAEDIINLADWASGNVHPDDKQMVIESINNCIENKLENWQAEYRYRSADGTYKYVYDRAFLKLDDNGRPTRMYGAMTDLTEKKRLKTELAEQQLKQQKQLLEVNIQAHEEEKSELGKELHDNISQMLATIKMYLGMARSGPSKSGLDLIGMSYTYVEETIAELRKLSHSLVPPSLGEINLKEVLQELINNIKLGSPFDIILFFDKNIKERDLDKKIELMVYRIVQEQINNIIKYARAKKITISLEKENEQLHLTIRDDGIGFDVSKKGKGIGLRNMANRVEYYTGNLKIISAPGQGCTINATIPLQIDKILL